MYEEDNSFNSSPQGYEPLNFEELRILSSLRDSGTAILIYLRLKFFAGNNGSAFPGQSTLAKEFGTDRVYVNRMIRRLEESGLVVRSRRGPRSSSYDLPFHRNDVTHKSRLLMLNDRILQDITEDVTHKSQQDVTHKSHRSKEVETKPEESTMPSIEKLSPRKALSLATNLVDVYLLGRAVWKPGYSTKAIREQAIRNCQNLLVRGEVDANHLQDLILWFVENDLPTTDYPYKVTNVFGKLARWKDIEKRYLVVTGATVNQDLDGTIPEKRSHSTHRRILSDIQEDVIRRAIAEGGSTILIGSSGINKTAEAIARSGFGKYQRFEKTFTLNDAGREYFDLYLKDQEGEADE